MAVRNMWRTRAGCVDTQSTQENKSSIDQQKYANIENIEHYFETTGV
jgi:hypothetical protein